MTPTVVTMKHALIGTARILVQDLTLLVVAQQFAKPPNIDQFVNALLDGLEILSLNVLHVRIKKKYISFHVITKNLIFR